MASVRIVNASPMILLGKIRRLELLFVDEPEVVVPSTTFSEGGLSAGGDELARLAFGTTPDFESNRTSRSRPKSSGTLWTAASRWSSR